MATQVASIGVGKLSSTSKYVDYFLVEIYSDSGHTNKIGQATSSAQYDSTSATWKQKDYISFPGLVFGTTYFLRAYTVAPLSGALSAPTDFSTAAGSASAPGCTYPGTFTATLSGIGYVITPGSVPSDIDHFEAVWTVNDATVPSSTTMPYWTGQTTNGSIAFFAGGKPNDVIRAYVRAVNTSQQAQAWQAVGSSITISTVFGGAYTGTLNDGTLLGNGGPGVFSGSTGRLGIGGAQGSPFLTAYGSQEQLSGVQPFLNLSDTGTSGTQYYMQSNAGQALWGQTGVSAGMYLNTSSQFGVAGTPGFRIDAYGQYIQVQTAGSTQFRANDTTPTTGRIYQYQSAGGTGGIFDATAGVQRTYLTNSGGYGIGTSPGSDFYYANSNRSYFQGVGPGVGIVDTTPTTGRLYMALSGSGQASGYQIYNGTNANYPLEIDNSARVGLGAITPANPLDVNGNMKSWGSGAGIYTLDRGGATTHVFYGASGYPRLFSGSADFATFNPSTGALGLGGTYTGDWISIQGTPVIASDKNLYNQIKVSGKTRTLADVQDLAATGAGQNQAENPDFELAPNAGSGDIAAGWFSNSFSSGGATVPGWTIIQEPNTSFTPYSGSNCIRIRLNNNVSVPSGQSSETDLVPRKVVPCKPGQKWWVHAKARTDFNVTLTSGLVIRCGVGCNVLWSDSTASFAGKTTEITNAGLGAWIDIFTTITIPNAPVGATAQGAQFYLYAVVNNPTGGTLSTNSTGVPCDFRIDNLEVIRAADLGSDEVAKIGSIPPAIAGSLSYSSTTSSIAWSWSMTLYRSDAAMTQQGISGSQTVTGLSSASTYNFYPFYDEGSLSGSTGLNMVATGGTGSPSWAHSGTSAVWTQEQTRADHLPLSDTPIAGSTTSSGTGSGSGGGRETGCHRKGTYVKERTRGVIRVEDVRANDYLWSENDTWLRVKSVKSWIHDLWILIEFNCGQKWFASAGHPYILRDGTIKRGCELTLADEVPCTTGITYPVSMQLVKEQHEIVKIEMEEPHTFYAATILDKPWVLSHNYNTA